MRRCVWHQITVLILNGASVEIFKRHHVCVMLQVTHTEETLASNTWSLMLKEVLSSLLKASEGLFSGLTLLSELLPLPLPMHSTQVTLSILHFNLL